MRSNTLYRPAEPIMTELVLNATATTLAAHLSARIPAPELVPHLGALTAHHLDAAGVENGAEIGALLRGAAVHDLGWLRRVAVRGEDRFRWLSGMVTNAVETLPEACGAYNLVLNAQGRIQGDVYVWRSSDSLEVEMTAEQSEALLTHFDHFIIMDDVELVHVTGQSALGITGPKAERILAALGLPALAEVLTHTTGTVSGVAVRLDRGFGTLVPHYALWADADQVPALWQAIVEAGATPVGAAALETLRIVEGIPAYGIDIQSRDLAQETSQDRAVSFTKGCYLGQEIVERIRSRGQVHRHLRSVELVPEGTFEVPSTGTELHMAASAAGGKPAGTLTSVAAVQLDGTRRIIAIAMIRAEAEVGSHPLMYPGGTAQILNAAPKLTAA
jgi:folate-binding protein YgfZ